MTASVDYSNKSSIISIDLPRSLSGQVRCVSDFDTGCITIFRLFNKVSKEARHHHYLPQCYLRGFLPVGQKKPKLTVLDLKKSKVFLTGTRGVGGIRDFNRIEADGVAPDSLENSLSSFEGQAATALKKLEEQHILTDNAIFDVIIKLIALLAIRNPKVRSNFANAKIRSINLLMAIVTAKKEIYESSVRNAKQDGVDIDESVPYEQVKEFFDRGEYNIVMPNESHFEAEFKGIDAILPSLFSRGWMLCVAGDNAGPFVTCDRPVILDWKHPEKIPPFYKHRPGFGLKDTIVIFPVSQNMAMIGEFDTPNLVVIADRSVVSFVNTEVIRFARPQVYAPDLSFVFINTKGDIRPGTELLLPRKTHSSLFESK